MDWERLAEDLRSHVERLARTPRTPETPAHQEAAQYIREQLQKAGFLVREEPFDEAGFEGTNLITQPIPDRSDLPLLIVGAHYDTKPATPGADDNASGVAAL
ncbi:MAG: M28 family peptidase, partial [Planctomycetes bacterium]|nr:M28 family peptidase [Planctomycetota bacterium]